MLTSRSNFGLQTNSVDPDQTALAVSSGSALFATEMLKKMTHRRGHLGKSLNEFVVYHYVRAVSFQTPFGNLQTYSSLKNNSRCIEYEMFALCKPGS